MTDYSELSDFEINKRVAQIHVGFALTLAVHDEPPSEKRFDPGRFDPCNNPADSWPIISDSRISIYFDQTIPEYDGEFEQWCCAISPCQNYQAQYQSNPLRAAMIVFLMMQERKE